MTKSSFDLHAEVTSAIIAAIEEGRATNTLPWQRTGLPVMLPANALTKADYRGINIVALWSQAMLHGYPIALWATYRQWAELGAQVRKGEKSSLVIFYKEFSVEPDPDQASDDGSRRMARASRVFNITQVDGYTCPELPALPPVTRLPNAEALIASTTADIRHGGDMAYYRPRHANGMGDFIQMPDDRLFAASGERQRCEDYYSVLLHELTHWSGAETRCNRVFGKRFGDDAYAMEELVAELGAAFLCSELSITSTPRTDHAGYIAHWLEVMKRDKRAIFTAAAKASEAVAYLKGRKLSERPS